MACIKYLGLCACPDCHLLKSKAHLLGSKSDISARERLVRTDSNDRRRRIDLARRLIFSGVNVTSKKIEDVLGSGSLVPTRVRSFQAMWTLLTCNYRMLFQINYLSMGLISIDFVLPICSTSLNSVFGRPSLVI
jgi:hypothetical protein